MISVYWGEKSVKKKHEQSIKSMETNNKSNNFYNNEGNWLVVEPTHLKNVLVKMGIFPNFRGENKKYLSCHHLGTFSSRPYFQVFHQESVVGSKTQVLLGKSIGRSVSCTKLVKLLFILACPFPPYEPGSINSLVLGDGKPPTLNDGNPYNGYINPYYWVDEFIPYYMEI